MVGLWLNQYCGQIRSLSLVIAQCFVLKVLYTRFLTSYLMTWLSEWQGLGKLKSSMRRIILRECFFFFIGSNLFWEEFRSRESRKAEDEGQQPLSDVTITMCTVCVLSFSTVCVLSFQHCVCFELSTLCVLSFSTVYVLIFLNCVCFDLSQLCVFWAFNTVCFQHCTQFSFG